MSNKAPGRPGQLPIQVPIQRFYIRIKARKFKLRNIWIYSRRCKCIDDRRNSCFASCLASSILVEGRFHFNSVALRIRPGADGSMLPFLCIQNSFELFCYPCWLLVLNASWIFGYVNPSAVFRRTTAVRERFILVSSIFFGYLIFTIRGFIWVDFSWQVYCSLWWCAWIKLNYEI